MKIANKIFPAMLITAWLFCIVCSYSFFYSYFFPKDEISKDSSLQEVKKTFDHDMMYVKFTTIVSIKKELKNKSLNANDKNILEKQFLVQKTEYNQIASEFSEEETWKWALPNHID